MAQCRDRVLPAEPQAKAGPMVIVEHWPAAAGVAIDVGGIPEARFRRRQWPAGEAAGSEFAAAGLARASSLAGRCQIAASVCRLHLG